MRIDVSWSSLPTEWLLAELAKRDGVADTKPQCGSGKKGSYDTLMHVVALILILALSTICTDPLPTLPTWWLSLTGRP